MIQTTVVGSYPVPMWLKVISNRESLRDAMLAVIKTQELAGIDLVADGELYRWDVNHAETNGMIDYFLRPLSGIRNELTRAELKQWRQQAGMGFRAKPPAIVIDQIESGALDLQADYALYRELSTLPKKFTVTSPYMLAKTLFDDFYRDLDTLVMALADVLKEQLEEIDADVIQVDEANVTGNPQDGALAARAINRVLEGVQGTKAVHLCFGNYGGQRIQQGTYQQIVEFLNSLEVDHLVLELARRPSDDLAILPEINDRIGLGIGVIDIKDNVVESKEVVAERIEVVADRVGEERIQYIHPDCGFWMLPRSVSDAKMRAMVEGRDLFQGRPSR
ncbi:MAG: methionine synthase [Planctomycetaceae bacterium]|nr:methionine synthase [Planctomycetaceae bacterium]